MLSFEVLPCRQEDRLTIADRALRASHLMRFAVASGDALEEVDGGAGIALALDHPILPAFARAARGAALDSVRFTWIAPGGVWHAVRVDAASADRAVLTAVRVEPPFGLTPRELDVLTLVAGGLTNADIGARLGARTRTVTTHLERLLAKLDQSNRAGAAGLAVDLGLIRLPVPGGGRSLAGLAAGRLDELLAGRRATSPKWLDQRVVPRPITIGTAVPLTGFMRSDGVEMLNGAQLAVEEINVRGGIAGRPVELLPVDIDILSRESVREGFTRLVDAEVEAITSGYTAAHDVAMDVVAEYGCPYLNAETRDWTIEAVREDPTRYGRIFHVCPGDTHYGVGFLRFIETLRRSRRWRPPNRRLAVAKGDWPGMHVGLDSLVDAAERSGWTIDFIDSIGAEPDAWERLTRRVQDAEPAALLLAHFFPQPAAAFQRAFLRRPTDTLVYTLYGPSVPEYLETLGPAGDGVLWATVTGIYGDAVGHRFIERYASRFRVEPGRSHAGIAYDRVSILASAMARVPNPRSFASVASEIRHVVHRGVTGAYFFDHAGQYGLAYPDATPDPSMAQAHLVFQIQDGRHRILFPGPYRDGRFRIPPWFRSRARAADSPPSTR